MEREQISTKIVCKIIYFLYLTKKYWLVYTLCPKIMCILFINDSINFKFDYKNILHNQSNNTYLVIRKFI